MRFLHLLLIFCAIVIISILACRRSLTLDELIKKPEIDTSGNLSLISGIELLKPTGSNNCHPCNCKLQGTSGNILQFEACDGLTATIKIKTDLKDWNFKLNPDMDTFFKVTRKTGDSINFLNISTRHITANGQSANLNIIAPDHDGKLNVVYSMVIGQKAQPLSCIKATNCTKPNSSTNTCPSCVATSTSSSQTISTTNATAPAYIKQVGTTQTNQVQTDTLILCKGTGSCGNKVYLAIETATKIACHPCNSTTSTASNNPCNAQQAATNSANICNAQGAQSAASQSPSKNCVDFYSENENIWVASAHSTNNWLKIRVLENMNFQNTTNVNSSEISTSVRATKKHKYLEIQATENNDGKVRNDGIIEFRAVGGSSTPIFKINVYQKK